MRVRFSGDAFSARQSEISQLHVTTLAYQQVLGLEISEKREIVLSRYLVYKVELEVVFKGLYTIYCIVSSVV